MNTEFYFPLKKEQLLEKPSDNRYWVWSYIFDKLKNLILI